MATMQRATIKDIARIARVSPGAVSFALNGKPGVSDLTRERILEVANSIGWTPSPAAKALSSAKASAVGLVLARPRASIESEIFYFRFISGVEQVLTREAQAFVLQLVEDTVEEAAVYRDWWAQRRVDGVLLVDPRVDDSRPGVLRSLGLPFVSVGEVFPGEKGVTIDDGGMLVTALDHLRGAGCNRVAFICGLPTLAHTAARVRSFRDHARALGMRGQLSAYTDYSEEAGATETAALMDSGEVPDAIIFDSDVLLVGGLAALAHRSLAWPDDVAVLSLEDSPLCRILPQAVTAFQRDPSRLGATASTLLLSGDPGEVVSLPPPKLIVRASTGTVRRNAGN